MKDTQLEKLTILREKLENLEEALKSSTIETEEALIDEYSKAAKEHSELLKDMDTFLPFYGNTNINVIKKVVCDYLEITIELLESKTRKREIVQARQIAMYFARH